MRASSWAWTLPFLAQGLAISFDEFYYHLRRNLPRWERIGHPLDTLSVVGCLAIARFIPYSSGWFTAYVAACIFSCLLITKDEWVHAETCSPGEHWLHAVLFVLHPVVLTAAGILWIAKATSPIAPLDWLPDSGTANHLLTLQLSALTVFLLYQLAFWLFFKPRMELTVHTQAAATQVPSVINNRCYNDLGARWYEAEDDPVALLRAEAKLRNAWVQQEISDRTPLRACAILDIACGGGFLSNNLAKAGARVTGIDASMPSLEVARQYDSTRTAQYLEMDAYRLGFADSTFDVVCAMDFLEHVDDPGAIIREASRVLKPGGIFFFHTFDRNPLSWLVVIKGVEWFVKNTPDHLHVYSLLVKPSEVRTYCDQAGMQVERMRGTRPKVFTQAFWKLLTTGCVSPDFEFSFTRSLALGYSGFAIKKHPLLPDPRDQRSGSIASI